MNSINVFLILIPLLVTLSGMFMYRFTGRKQIMKFDLVQFIYAFVIGPVMFVWLKSFLFFILRTELDLGLSVSEVFALDSAFTILMLYVYSFVVIHSLTKTFDLHREIDPLYDIFEHSEYFHQLISHVAIYFGAMLLMAFLSVINIFVPMNLIVPRTIFYIVLLIGVSAGVVGFVSVWSYNSSQQRFYRIMKLVFGFFFLVHVALYILTDPEFSANYSAYWFIFVMFFTMVIMAFFAEKPEPESSRWNLPFVMNWRKPKFYAKSVHKLTKKLLSKG